MNPARIPLDKHSSSTDSGLTSVLAETKPSKRVKISTAPTVKVEDLDKWESTTGLGERTKEKLIVADRMENGSSEKTVVKARKKVKKKAESLGRVDDDRVTLADVNNVDLDDSTGEVKKRVRYCFYFMPC